VPSANVTHVHVELRLRGTAYRLVNFVFGDYDVASDGGVTVVSGTVVDEAAALALIDRARNMGLTVTSWKCASEDIDGEL
jgi:hypothetical protein